VDAAVLEVLGLVREQAWLADRALEVVLRRQKRLYSVERRAAAEAVYGVIRAQGRIEWLLGRRAAIAELYAAALASPGGIPQGEAERRLGLQRGALAPLSGAEARIQAIEDPVARLGVEGSLPPWLAERLVAEVGLEEARAFSAAVNVRAPLTVRANLLKGTRDDLRIRLEEEGVESKETPLSPWGLVLDGHANAFGLDAFKGGLFEVQDEGSQLIVLACGARSGMKVVDACAGAGGKSLALAAEMRNRGVLLALDVDADRLDEARRRARRAGVDNLRTKALPPGDEADAALRDEEGKADVVLVDAPCSGLGTLRRKPDARWRLGPADPGRFAETQRGLVRRFSRLVKPGGRLVYATCSVARVENEEVAASAAALPGFVPAPLEKTLGAGVARAAGATGNELRLWPHRHGTDGFFVAAFERRKD
jgi:16S rRNA (cytosine967-C5)-methyltransferase